MALLFTATMLLLLGLAVGLVAWQLWQQGQQGRADADARLRAAASATAELLASHEAAVDKAAVRDIALLARELKARPLIMQPAGAGWLARSSGG